MANLTLTATVPNSSVTLVKHGEPTHEVVLEYRIVLTGDSSSSGSFTLPAWSVYTFGTQCDLPSIGDYVEFRAGQVDTSSSEPEDKYSRWFSSDATANYFQFTMTGKIAASGRLESLINFSVFTNCCFANLFLDCTSLVSAPSLYSTYGRIRGTNIFYRTFENTSIEYVEIPYMLSFAIYTPFSEVQVSGTAYRMFYNCSKLSTVVANFSGIDDPTLTDSWLTGTASAGTWVCKRSFTWANEPVRSDSTVPEGWTIVYGGNYIPGAGGEDGSPTIPDPQDPSPYVTPVSYVIVPNFPDAPVDQRSLCLNEASLKYVPVPYVGLQIWLLIEKRLVVVDAVSSVNTANGPVIRITAWHYMDPGYKRVYLNYADDSDSFTPEYEASGSEWIMCDDTCTIKLPKAAAGTYIKISTVKLANYVVLEPALGDTIEGQSGISISAAHTSYELYGTGTDWVIVEVITSNVGA